MRGGRRQRKMGRLERWGRGRDGGRRDRGMAREGRHGCAERGQIEIGVSGVEVEDLVLLDESDFDLFLCGGELLGCG